MPAGELKPMRAPLLSRTCQEPDASSRLAFRGTPCSRTLVRLQRASATRCSASAEQPSIVRFQPSRGDTTRRVGQRRVLSSNNGRASIIAAQPFLSPAPMFPNLFARWRTRDAEARRAEDSVLGASLRALERRGALPSMEKRDKARQLRQGADALLEAAFAEVKNRTDPGATTPH